MYGNCAEWDAMCAHKKACLAPAKHFSKAMEFYFTQTEKNRSSEHSSWIRADINAN